MGLTREFDVDLHAFYYVRVIEIPTPRWTAYDAKRFGLTMPNKVTMTVQDWAYTSPIWYTPELTPLTHTQARIENAVLSQRYFR